MIKVSDRPQLYVDFQNADAQGRVRLNAVGTMNDLAAQQVKLEDGLLVDVFSDDADENDTPRRLVAAGVVAFSSDEQCWVAAIDWEKLRSEPVSSGADAAVLSSFTLESPPLRHTP